MNVASAKSPCGPVVLIVYPSAVNADPAPTLNLRLAESTPVLLTEHAGSPDVSTIIVNAAAVTVHAPEGLKPEPVTVTSVAAAPGEPLTGGEPLEGLSVICGVTVNAVDAESP
jgi:hypothetical protein